MRIGVDGGCWSNRRGYGRFLREIVRALGEIDRRNSYVIFLDSHSAEPSAWPPCFEPRRVETGQPIAEAARAEGRRSLGDVLSMSRAASRESFDLFFFPSVYSFFPLLKRTKILVAVHDTIAENHPASVFSTAREAFFWKMKVLLALSQADACLTVSEYSRRSIRRVYGEIADPVHVIGEAPAEIFRAESPSSADRENFLLYAGGISPSKNLVRLVRAFSSSKARAVGARLVLAGDHSGDSFTSSFAELIEMIRRLGLEDSVGFTGYIPDSELASLYRRARLFVMPSLEEGFGLPAVEAMAGGAPVLYSAGNSLDEVVGEAGLSFDPHRTSGIRSRIDQAYFNPALSAELSRRGLERATRFRWRNAAERLIDVFDQTAE